MHVDTWFRVSIWNLRKIPGTTNTWKCKVTFVATDCSTRVFAADTYKEALLQQGSGDRQIATTQVDASATGTVTVSSQESEFITEAATMATQTCHNDAEISASAECPTQALILPSSTSSSSSSSTPLAMIIAPIVGVVLLSLIMAAIVVIRRRQAAQVKSITTNVQQETVAQRV